MCLSPQNSWSNKATIQAEELADYPRAIETLVRSLRLQSGVSAQEVGWQKSSQKATVCGHSKTIEMAYLRVQRASEASQIYLLSAEVLRAGGAGAHLHNANEYDLLALQLDPGDAARTSASERLEKGLGEESRWSELAEFLEFRRRRNG